MMSSDLELRWPVMRRTRAANARKRDRHDCDDDDPDM